MKLSAPIYHLKRTAKQRARDKNIPLHDALDQIAVTEGFASWSLLAAKHAKTTPAAKLFPQLKPGDLVLVAARPGHGKTMLSVELVIEAMKSGSRGVFFSLEYTEAEALRSFRAHGMEPAQFEGLFEIDCADTISAGYIIKRMSAAPPATVVVVDYLQLLDQRRENPELMAQVRTLKAFARERGLIIIFISQVDRSYDPSKKPFPDLEDVRLPNPLDLKLFNNTRRSS